MTTGTYVNDYRIAKPRLLQTAGANGVYGAPSISGTPLYGSYRTKTWDGTNAAPAALRPVTKRRVRTVLRSGKYYKITVKDRLPIRAKFRDPQIYTMTAQDFRSPLGWFQTDVYSSGTYFSGTRYSDCSLTGWGGIAALPALPTWTSNDDIKLIGKLREKIQGTDFNMSVFLGEGHQTLKLLGDTTIKLARSYSLFRKGDVVGAIRTLEAGRKFPSTTIRGKAGSSWLELQYGWMPLLKDMKEGAEQLAHYLSVPFRQKYVARRTIRVNADGGAGTYYAYNDCYSFVRKQIIAFVSEPATLPQLLGLMDPELVVWELIPFSFVVDWFAPVGDYLNARALAGKLSGSFVTSTLSKRYVGGLKPKPYSSGSTTYVFSCSDGGYKNEVSSFTRSISSVLSVPLPVVKPLNKALSFQHCLNALALLAVVVSPKATVNTSTTGPSRARDN